MTLEELKLLLQVREQKPLSEVKVAIFEGVFRGYSYSTIADRAGYSEVYVKTEAAKLWHELSIIFGCKITKSNMPSVITDQVIEPSTLLEMGKLLRDELQLLPHPDGPVPLNSPLYVPLVASPGKLLRELRLDGGVVRLQSAYGTGKTSFLLRLVDQLKTTKYEVVTFNLKQVESSIVSNFDRLLRWVIDTLCRHLNLDSQIDQVWSINAGSSTSCTLYLQQYILPYLEQPLVLAFDDLDCVFSSPHVCQDFLVLLRSWIELAKTHTDFGKLRFVLVHATETQALINLNQSPLNVGLLERLLPMQVEQVQHLALLHGFNWLSTSDHPAIQAQTLHYQLGGQPQLIRKSLHYLVMHSLTLDDFLQEVLITGGIFRVHFQRVLEVLNREPTWFRVVLAAVQANEPILLDPFVEYALELLGIVTLEDGRAVLNLPIFCSYLRYHFLN